MIKRIMRVACCSLILCCLMCGCDSGKEDVLLIGKEEFPVSGIETEGLETDVQEAFTEICVYVCGAVKNPGVVYLPEGSRAADALEAAGGFDVNAAIDYVNLAAKVSDGEKLYFPNVEESITDLQSEGSCEKLININTADAEILCTLPGIGETRAADIIRYRETSGLFENCEDIMKVSGIKNALFEKMRDDITVD